MDVVGHIKSAILGITESDPEVNGSGYKILKSDGNPYGGVTCYVRANLCFIRRNIFSNSIEIIFFDLS